MCLARPYTARHQATKDCSVLHSHKLMSLGVMCVYGGVSVLRLVNYREREARWKLGGMEYLLCLCVMCVWLWLGGWGIPYLNYPLYALSVQNIITVSAPVHGIMARTSACRDWTWNCSG